MSQRKIAIVLFNLGGPDTPRAIRPFLYNLFADKRIIGLPAPLRQLVAFIISATRAPKVAPLYAEMGGASPILANTRAQEAALAEATGHKVFTVMRYWHPRAKYIAKELKNYDPETIVLLPLYPQFSTTTSESSFAEWKRAAKAAGLKCPTKTICCYPMEEGFIHAMAEMTAAKYNPARPARILFSAHGLPEKIIREKGDPYVRQVEMTAAAIVRKMNIPNLDYKVTYQSRVGPVEWVKPYTDAEIKQAGAEGKPLILAPIAFVSEHIETLVELDVENKKLALDSGCPSYERVPTVSTHPAFIEGLAKLVEEALARPAEKAPAGGKRICPEQCFACTCN